MTDHGVLPAYIGRNPRKGSKDMTALKVGDKVKATIVGTIGEYSPEKNGCHAIKTDGRAYTHYVYLGGFGGIRSKPGVESDGLTVELIQAGYEAGKAYVDADKEVFLRSRAGGWLDMAGREWRDEDAFVSLPMILLVPDVK